LRKLPLLLLSALLATAIGAASSRASVILSELCDPTANYTIDRFIEVYNSGPDAVDLAGWSVVAVANNVDVVTWPLSGTLAAGQAKVCGSTTATTFTVDFPSALWATSAGYMNWNGRAGDGAKLKNPGGTVVDLVLATGTEFENKDMVRNSYVTLPSPTFVFTDWTATALDVVAHASPGSHNGSAPPALGPVITGVVTDPATPLADAAVHVQAGVVDTSGALTAVTLYWGIASSSQPNAIAMSLLSGSTYRTDTPIPGQPAGASVYYKVQASDAATTNTSPLVSYTLGGGSAGAPTVLWVGEMSDSTLLVGFSEPVEQASAETPSNYTVGALTAVAAARDPLQPSQVLVTVRAIPAGTQQLVVNGVADLTATVAYGATCNFNYVDVSIPAGYYAGTQGLKGSALRVALHNLIKAHTPVSYAGALSAFATTDVKPNGKIWDMYSDVPGGTPPYEYAVGQTGQGAGEGLGYNREHSFPQSWFGGASPMYSDLWILLPTDSYVNGHRSNYAYGTVATASYTSLNGSKLGTSASAGYSGIVFEPIDAYKGDLARSTFYVATRYFNEDAGWPGGAESSGAELFPWAAQQYREWSATDPVSWKERMRNGAIYVIQHNRNPFVDHPEFVTMIYDSNSVAGVADRVPARSIRLRPNSPNPFSRGTSIGFDLVRRGPVTLGIYDVTGRRVRTLADGAEYGAGGHQLEWNGHDDGGAVVQAGLYFCRLGAGAESETRRIVFAR
jgi:hypothetical protein